MTKRKLLIASPAKSGLPHDYLSLYVQLMAVGIPGWEISMVTEANQNAIAMSRNILADFAVRKGFDRVIMRDLDNPATVGQFERILSHDHDECPIVSGLYCKKAPGDPFWLGMRKPGAEHRADGLLEAHFLPTGFLSISTDALKKIASFHPDREFYVWSDKLTEYTALTPGPKVTEETQTEWFPIGVNGTRTPASRLRRIKKLMAPIIEKGNVAFFPKATLSETLQNILQELQTPHEPGYYCGEDYGFSVLAHQAGIKMYIDCGCVVEHIGSIKYPITDTEVVAKKCMPVPTHEGNVETW